MSTTASTPAPAEDAPAESAAPTECTYDESLKDYLKCNKQRFTTTQLVGAGIGVTILIFAIGFSLIWFCRRRRTPPRVKLEERDLKRSNTMDEDSHGDIESDSEGDDDDDDRKKVSDKNEKGLPPAPDEKEYSQTAKDLSRDQSDTKSIRSVRPPPTARLGDDLKTSTRNGHLSAPGSRASSHAGSPIEPQGVRNLYPSNPDAYNSPRSTLYGAPPSKGSRPPSTYSQSGRPATQYANTKDHPMPIPPRGQSAMTNTRPLTSSGLKPVDSRVHPSRSTSVAGSRRPSIAPSDRSSGVLPDEQDMETMTRTPSVRSAVSSTDPTQVGGIARPPPSRSSSIVSTLSRPPSRMSVASRKSTYTPTPPDAEPAMPPPAYHEGVVQNVGMRPQPVRSGTIISQVGNARMSSAASVEVFEDAQESQEAAVAKPAPGRPAARRQQAI